MSRRGVQPWANGRVCRYVARDVARKQTPSRAHQSPRRRAGRGRSGRGDGRGVDRRLGVSRRGVGTASAADRRPRVNAGAVRRPTLSRSSGASRHGSSAIAPTAAAAASSTKATTRPRPRRSTTAVRRRSSRSSACAPAADHSTARRRGVTNHRMVRRWIVGSMWIASACATTSGIASRAACAWSAISCRTAWPSRAAQCCAVLRTAVRHDGAGAAKS